MSTSESAHDTPLLFANLLSVAIPSPDDARAIGARSPVPPPGCNPDRASRSHERRRRRRIEKMIDEIREYCAERVDVEIEEENGAKTRKPKRKYYLMPASSDEASRLLYEYQRAVESLRAYQAGLASKAEGEAPAPPIAG